MHRREIMSWAGIAAAGAFLAPASTLAASPAARRSAESFVPAKDGTSLFVRDWGAGRPVLFLAGWALPSDFWGYQMLALGRPGTPAIASYRRWHSRLTDPGHRHRPCTVMGESACPEPSDNLGGVHILA